jgi:hypothetical protein
MSTWEVIELMEGFIKHMAVAKLGFIMGQLCLRPESSLKYW